MVLPYIIAGVIVLALGGMAWSNSKSRRTEEANFRLEMRQGMQAVVSETIAWGRTVETQLNHLLAHSEATDNLVVKCRADVSAVATAQVVIKESVQAVEVDSRQSWQLADNSLAAILAKLNEVPKFNLSAGGLVSEAIARIEANTRKPEPATNQPMKTVLQFGDE